MLTKLTSHPVVKNGLISLAGFGSAGVVGYIFQFFMSRQLSITQYGEFQSLVALLGILGIFSAALSYFVISHTSVFAHHQDYTANRQFLHSLTRRLTAPLLILLVVFALASAPLQQVLHLTDVWSATIIGATAVLALTTVVYTGMFSGWQAFDVVNLLAVAGMAFKLMFAVIIISFLPTASLATLVLLAAAAGTWLLARAISARRFKLTESTTSPDGKTWRTKYFADRNVTRDIGYILIFTFLALVVQNADVLLVKHFASAELAGHYGAFNLLGKIILWMNLGIATVILPIAVASEHTGRATSKRVRPIAYSMIGLISLTAIASYLTAPELVVKLTVGSNYLLYTPVLWQIAVMNTLLSLLLLEANFAFARRDRAVLYTLGAAAVIFAVGITRSHHTIAGVAKSGIIAFGAGVLATALVNLRAPKPT